MMTLTITIASLLLFVMLPAWLASDSLLDACKVDFALEQSANGGEDGGANQA